MDELMSMSKIFTEKIFRIPDYQRGYAWTEKEIKDFWGDICRLEEKKNHYVGVLTLEKTPKEKYNDWKDDLWIIDAKSYEPYYVVDGQQRLTTSIILIFTLLKIMKERNIETLNYTSQEEIIRKYMYEFREKNQNRTYIYGYEADNPSYSFLAKEIYEDNIISSIDNSITIYTENLLSAKQYFYNRLKEMTIKDLESVFSKITQHFLFNMYIISDDIDVYVTFETMNNRGKLLSDLELLKNRLIYLSTLFSVEEYEKMRLRRDINNCWKNVYHVLGKNPQGHLLDDDFLYTHTMVYFQDNMDYSEERIFRITSRKSNLSEYLLNTYFAVSNIANKQLSIEDCHKYINSLNDSITVWELIQSSDFPNSSDVQNYISKITRLVYPIGNYYPMYYQRYRFSHHVNILLLACMSNHINNQKTIIKFLKALEKYIFIVQFYAVSLLDTDDYMLNIMEIVRNVNKKNISIKDVIEKLEKASSQISSHSSIAQKTIDFYSKNGFYETNWIKYFLYEYEMDLTKKSKTHLYKIDQVNYWEKSLNTIEHIYPQNARNSYWTQMFNQYTSKERFLLKNSLGNLVALSNEKNGKLGNKPFPEKKSNKENPVGYKYGTYAEIELTNYDDWDAMAILDRGLKLVDFLYERWNIRIGAGKKNEKVKFLGLSFLKY